MVTFYYANYIKPADTKNMTVRLSLCNFCSMVMTVGVNGREVLTENAATESSFHPQYENGEKRGLGSQH